MRNERTERVKREMLIKEKDEELSSWKRKWINEKVGQQQVISIYEKLIDQGEEFRLELYNLLMNHREEEVTSSRVI